MTGRERGQVFNVFRVVRGGVLIAGEFRDRLASTGARKVGNETKTGYAELRLSAVELCDDV